MSDELSFADLKTELDLTEDDYLTLPRRVSMNKIEANTGDLLHILVIPGMRNAVTYTIAPEGVPPFDTTHLFFSRKFGYDITLSNNGTYTQEFTNATPIDVNLPSGNFTMEHSGGIARWRTVSHRLRMQYLNPEQSNDS